MIKDCKPIKYRYLFILLFNLKNIPLQSINNGGPMGIFYVVFKTLISPTSTDTFTEFIQV